MVSTWKTTTIGALASVSRGASPRPIASPRWFDPNSKIRWIRIADVNRADGRTLHETTQALSADGVARSRYLSPGTLIMSIAATVGIPVITGVPACIHDGFVSLENLKADKRFMLYLLKASEARFREAGQSGSQMNVNSDIVRGLAVRVPDSTAEQERIGSALWDMDDLVACLEQLITKKRALKHGMTQELLAEQASAPSVTRALSSISSFITKGATPTTYGFSWETSGVPFLRSECVSAIGLDMAQAMFISPEADVALARSRVRDGDILMTITGNVGRVVWLTGLGAANINQHIARIRVTDPGFDSGYVFHFLSQPSVRAHYESITTGQAFPQISLAQVRATGIPAIPLQEQRTIAASLSDADVEIDALERRLDTCRAIKQGMMQELLTGRTRLMPAEASA